MVKQPEGPDLVRRARDRVGAVADALAADLPRFGRGLNVEMAGAIPELSGDPTIADLLRASTDSNVESFLHAARYEISLDDVVPPPAAKEFARRLAQRGTSLNALLRAYRLGQQRVLELAFGELERQESDSEVVYAASKMIQESAFGYVDRIAQQVVAEYELERERWLAHRNTVRAGMLASLLGGADVDVAAGEQALSYRLRQNHLGVLLRVVDDEQGDGLRRIERLLGAIAEALGVDGAPLFVPQDRALAWGWIPLGRRHAPIDLDLVERTAREVDSGIRIAVGRVGAAVPGFRATHLEARRAHAVATSAGSAAHRVTSYAEAGVRVASLLTGDLAQTRELVAEALGGLASDDESAERLRETLLIFLAEKGSYQATGERTHLHRNTVKYRVDKAIETRGRPLDEDRLNLEVALLACAWLGPAVLG